jgi:hypothetical protein
VGLYHALAENDWMLIQNLKASSGKIFSASYTGMSGAVTKYQVFNKNQNKECSFERIRISEFPEYPSRMGAQFCFTNTHDAEYANEHWWHNPRKIVRAQLSDHRSYGLFDSRHLDCAENDWDEAARRYFSGKLTENHSLKSSSMA